MTFIFRNIKAVLSTMTKNDWAFLFCLIFCAALLASKYLLSLCTIALAVLAVFDMKKPYRPGFNPAWHHFISRGRERWPVVAISLIFFTYLVFGFPSENQAQYWSLVRMKLSFLVWPIIFILLPRFSKRQYLLLFYFLMLNICMSAFFVLAAYLSDVYLFNRALGYGHSLPTPMNHIRYSLLITMSVLGGIAMIQKHFYWRWKWERFLIILMTVGLFIFQHVLSVRTGLVLSYVGILILLLHYGFRSRYKTPIILLIACIMILPVIAFQTIPAFQRKVGYTLYDLDKFRAGEGSGYADSERFRSWQAGLAIASESPFLGTGFGDVKAEIIDYYKTQYHSDQYWKPHNQYISVFAGGGLLGLFLFMFGLLFPICYQRNAMDELFLAFYITFLLSMLIEATLNSYIGSSIFLLFTLVGLSQSSEDLTGTDRS